MSNQIKLTDEEIESVNSIQQTFATLTVQTGKTTLALHEVNQEQKRLTELSTKLLNEFDDNVKKQDDLSKQLFDKYGSGFVDIPSGLYIQEEGTTESTQRNLQERVVQ